MSELAGWELLRHEGLLLDTPRLRVVAANEREPLSRYYEHELRRRIGAVLDGGYDIPKFVTFVITEICGIDEAYGRWHRGPQVSAERGRMAVTGEVIKPRQLWVGENRGVLPVFIDKEKRVGIGRGKKALSHVLQWLRAGQEQLAVLTNGREWRLIFAGLDFDAWCEWDIDLWLEEGGLSPQVATLRTLFQLELWRPAEKGATPKLLQAVLDSRKGQAELSQVLGERVREAVEILVQAHGESLKEHCSDVDPAEIYRAAVRMVMRMVVVLFAESRELLPADNQVYHDSYGLKGLLEELEKVAMRGGNRLARSWSAWPRMLSLFRLVYSGSHHPELPVPAYGGELFAPGDADAAEGLNRAVAVFEREAFRREMMSDREVHRVLERITRTRVKVRQGRSSTWVPTAVDFSDLSSEYIGILYEGLLDFELKTAPSGDPVIFLAVGNQPALPLSRLEAMDDKALKNLLEKTKDTSSLDDEGEDTAAEADDTTSEEDEEEVDADTHDALDKAADGDEAVETDDDERHTTRTRAEQWGRKAAVIGGLVRKPRGKLTPEKKLAHEEAVGRKARQLVARVILPGEWYLVRWGGTRKGSGTFYTRPGLAVPTVQRTLRPLAWDPPTKDGKPDRDAPPVEWTPKRPEEILALKVVDPACGSGTFPVAALRFLTDAVYAALHHHDRLSGDVGRPLDEILGVRQEVPEEERLGAVTLPCRPEDEGFEEQTKALLRRYVVERCIYGVDLDPLATELCRLALWIETMDETLPFSFLDHKIKCGSALIGAWFDQFQHYPVMAWKNRVGGDKSHSNGVHFKRDAWTTGFKDFVKDRLTPDVRRFIEGRTLFAEEDPQEQALSVHDEAMLLILQLHELPVHNTAERSRIYREELLGSAAYHSLKTAMDTWCACWFWPPDMLEYAPLASELAEPTDSTIAVVEHLVASRRFFHWELEFPDVFRERDSGFDAVLGNPPWDTLQPNSKEYFSNIDPLYRGYGKQEALRYQTEYFADEATERAWLEYVQGFADDSNWMKHGASPFGDPIVSNKGSERFAIGKGKANLALHERWRELRETAAAFADAGHPFRHRGQGKAYTYKLFLEQAYALLRNGGRLGFVVPSGLYSDYGTGALRELFLDHCRWEWLFGFENREKIFDIDSRFKFNPVIIEKGGKTNAIRTAFMRRRLEDWERGEELTTWYTRDQVDQFSPRSKAILEIQSARDLEILEKIYANSVLLGDDGPDGWGIKYAQGDFNMTSDSKLFPPRPKWEEQGYRPDEYSRWLKGKWRPIGELWAELSVDPARPVPLSPDAERAVREGDVIRGDHPVRCAQPPYNRIPVPRADIPEGIVLSREADAWIEEGEVEDVALPLYEGRMIGQFDFSQKGWVSGKGRGAVWDEVSYEQKTIRPQYLMAGADYIDRILDLQEDEEDPSTEDLSPIELWSSRLSLIDVTSSTNSRTTFTALAPAMPHGHSAPLLRSGQAVVLNAVMNSFVFDFCARQRLSGLHLLWAILEELAIPRLTAPIRMGLLSVATELNVEPKHLAPLRIIIKERDGLGAHNFASTHHERTRLRSVLDALAAAAFGLDDEDLRHVLQGCDQPAASPFPADPKGFWRAGRRQHPEVRQSVLALVALQDFGELLHGTSGDLAEAVGAFVGDGTPGGWTLPASLRLADYGLGHDDRAKEPQPVASQLGPRFYDWQLAQDADESWRECHLHARNLLGAEGYRQLLSDIEAEKRGEGSTVPSKVSEAKVEYDPQGSLGL